MENDSIFSKLAHGPEVSGNCQCPTKSNTIGKEALFEHEANLPSGGSDSHQGGRPLVGRSRWWEKVKVGAPGWVRTQGMQGAEK